MNLGIQNWKKSTSQFCWSVGRCETECTRACPQAPLGCSLPASLEKITSFFPKKISHFQEINPNIWASSSQGQGSPHGQTGKAKACLRTCYHGHGSHHGQAAKAKVATSNQGQGMPPSTCMDLTTFLFIKGQIYVSVW